MCLKDADGMANNVGHDQAVPFGVVQSGSALFAQTYLFQYLEFYGSSIINVIWCIYLERLCS